MTRPTPWTNWAGNQTFSPQTLHIPNDVDEVCEIVAKANAVGQTVRAIGSGHSSMNLMGSKDVMINLRKMNGVVDVDVDAETATLLPGTLISEIGPALWDHGLCLRNQGDIDGQQIAGAIATGTHGSGLKLQSLSAGLLGAEMVTSQGELRRVDASDPGRLAASQVSMGLLGLMTSLQISVRKAFFIKETIEYWSLDDLMDRWSDYFANKLHFSFFWMPATVSPSIFNMRVPDRVDMADRTYVKIYDEIPLQPEAELEGYQDDPAQRLDRPYRIYPEVPTPGFHELEYMVPFKAGKHAFDAIRDLMLIHYPDQKHPVEVRCTARDDAYLSPNYERDSLVIAVHCDDLVSGEPFLRAASQVLEQFEARPHWGKHHFMDTEHIERVFPRLDEFRSIRRAADPDGLFLNPYLTGLFG